MQDQIVLEAKNVSKTVASPDGALTILADVSLTVRTGETLAIVGASGAGKSTLLALLAGLDAPSTGRVLIAGIDLTELDEDGRAAIRGKHVGFVFQSFHLIPSLTAIENVMLPLELGGRRDARQAAGGRARAGGTDAAAGALSEAAVRRRAAARRHCACLRDASRGPVRGRTHRQLGHRHGATHHRSLVRFESQLAQHVGAGDA